MKDRHWLTERCHRLQEDGPGPSGVLLVSDAGPIAEHEHTTRGAPYGEGVAGKGRLRSHWFKSRRDLIPHVAQFQNHTHRVPVNDAIDWAHVRPFDSTWRQTNRRRGRGQKPLPPGGDCSLDIAAGDFRGNAKKRGNAGSDFSQGNTLAKLVPYQPRSLV